MLLEKSKKYNIYTYVHKHHTYILKKKKKKKKKRMSGILEVYLSREESTVLAWTNAYKGNNAIVHVQCKCLPWHTPEHLSVSA